MNRKGQFIAIVVLFITLGMFASVRGVLANENELVAADFNSGTKPNNIGGDFGSWDKDPNDETQKITMSFVSDDALGNIAGYSIRLDYDVDSPNPAYNGFWMKLNNLDASPYNVLSFYIKGAQTGFTSQVKIELKDNELKPSSHLVANITDKWQKISIPLDKFRRIKNWNSLAEFVVVFDDMNSKPKKGTIYIDQITFLKE